MTTECPKLAAIVLKTASTGIKLGSGPPSEVIAASVDAIKHAQSVLDQHLSATDSAILGSWLSAARKCVQLTNSVSIADIAHSTSSVSGNKVHSRYDFVGIVIWGLKGLLALGVLGLLLLTTISPVVASLLFGVYIGLDFVQSRITEEGSSLRNAGTDERATRKSIELVLPYNECQSATESMIGATDGVVARLSAQQKEIHELRQRMASSEVSTSELAMLTTLQKILSCARRNHPDLADVVRSQLELLLSELSVRVVSLGSDSPSGELFETQEDLSGTVETPVEMRPALVRQVDGKAILRGLVVIPAGQ